MKTKTTTAKKTVAKKTPAKKPATKITPKSKTSASTKQSPAKKFKVWSGGNGRKFDTLKDASAYAEQVRKKTGHIVAVTEVQTKPRASTKKAPAKKTAPKTAKTATKKMNQGSSACKNSVKKPVSTKQQKPIAKKSTSGRTKADFLSKHKVKVRKATDAERKMVSGEYARKAKCIITYNGKDYLSRNGSLSDIKYVVNSNKKVKCNGKK